MPPSRADRYDRTSRFLVPLACLVAAALLVPGPALAHPRGPAIALDYRLRLSSNELPGVHAEVIDGDRNLRLRVDPSAELVVRGLLGEPVLRFSPAGVWVNRRSPTAAADRLTKMTASGPPWVRLTRGHSLTWHDHRLAPPRGLAAGATKPWSLPVTLDGRPAALTGTFVHVPGPRVWPWIVGAIGALGLFLAAGRRFARDPVPSIVAALAASATTAAMVGFATGDPITRAGQWAKVGIAALLALVAVATLGSRNRSIRGWAAALVGIWAAVLAVGSLSVFWHGVVISSLSASATRLLTLVGLVGGAAAALLGGVLAWNDEAPVGERSDDSSFRMSP